MWRDQVLNSLQYVGASIEKFVYDQPFIFIIFIILLLWSSFSWFIKIKLKRKYIIPYERSGNTENKEFYVKYYKKVQYIDIFGAIIGIFLIFIYLLTKDKIVGAVRAVGVGGILITFQTFTVSLFTYFILIRNYKIGDTIKINISGEKIQGEILYIKLLHIGISGKNNFGENTGQFYVVPNYQAWNNPIVKVDLALNNYSKDSLTIIYDSQLFTIPFSKFIEELKEYLDLIFPLRSATDVSYYKSYIGVKYKIDYSYTEEGMPCIRIGFVEKRLESKYLKEKIISFVEDKKKTK